MSTGRRSFSSLISTQELASSQGRVKVLDGSWHMPNANRDPYQEFLNKRIPGARFFGIDEIKDTTVSLPHMLPTPEAFAAAVGKLGITHQDPVVVYDSAGFFSAARVYWTFKAFGHQDVAVLQGGLPRWETEKRPLESGDPSPVQAVEYKVPQLNVQLVRDYEQVLANAKQGGKPAQVLDARPNPRFTGEAPEPRPGLSSGHMPGSFSVPFNEVVQDGDLLAPEDLRRIFEGKGIKLDGEIVASCGSGITASILYMALERAGANRIAVYDGSWTEYADRKESLIEKDV
ncbi:Rhodanese-like domain-containing protein [Syncephalastrum racemosum]|uniref:Rhodanese-like domain-containing protein n=1 Tax=Syncephalastrum racemosum TaxID=13706 RepID=A0A1X2H5B9_SYNRA|nr:Rhodanese-like domain-containing protein [Syncephalastrum racemosum]